MTTQPDLPIAVVGTTSSGKSTLLNLLSGRFLLTPKVQESPRVRVELWHRPWPNNLTVYDPLSPHLGPIHLDSDAAGRHVLQTVIQRIARLPEGERLNLSIRVDVPLLIAPPHVNSPGWWGCFAGLLHGPPKVSPRLPVGYNFVLRDLPGFLNCDDRESRQLISASLSDAMVLFVINAAEVDHRKENELVRLVLRQCRRQGRGWKQVFFALNRVDLFGLDAGQQGEMETRISTLRQRLAAAARDEYDLPQLPEPPVIHPIATLPALASQLLSAANGCLDRLDRDYLLDTAIDYAGRLVPPEIARVLPRSRDRWEANHVHSFCRHAASASHWNDFRLALCRHVHQSTPPRLPALCVTSRALTTSTRGDHAAPLAIWRFDQLRPRIRPGQRLRLELLAPAVVHWSPNDWATLHDSPGWATGLGTYLIDLPTEHLAAGSRILFTFFWPEAARWEGRNFAVEVADR